MGKQDIIDAIIAGAEGEAEGIISDAEAVAARILKEAEDMIAGQKAEAERVADDRAKAIIAGKQATARLDGAKITLAGKREVIDGIYAAAYERLCKMSAADCLKMTENLLATYAEEGDEIIFADGYPCAKQVSSLKVVEEKKLKITFGSRNVKGGFILCGKKSDKDLSYACLLQEDREKHEAEIASRIFK